MFPIHDQELKNLKSHNHSHSQSFKSQIRMIFYIHFLPKLKPFYTSNLAIPDFTGLLIAFTNYF